MSAPSYPVRVDGTLNGSTGRCPARTADVATSPVSADVAIGAEVPVLAAVAVGMLICGSVILVLSVAVIVAAVRR